MRLVDADTTIKYLREFRCKDCDKRKGMKNGKMRFCYAIGNAPCRACDIGDTIDYFLDESISPTIDAVPVVRCKDCKYWLPMDRFHQDYHPGRGECELNCWVRDSDWYCADGERRR